MTASTGTDLGEGLAWTAISLTGTMAGSYKYVSSATFYCPASSFKAALSGNPHLGRCPVQPHLR